MSEPGENNENEETAAEEAPEAVADAAGEDTPPESDGDGAEDVAAEAEADAEPEAEAEAEPAEEPVAEAEPADDASAEDVAAEAEADADEEPQDEVPEEYREAADEAPADEGVEVDASEVVALAAKTARVYLCECGYRTYAVWSEPTVCKNRPTRHGPECGKQLYPMDELPEQVQKALNPLKASKKRAAGAA